MAEVALAWVTDRPAVTSTILGARTVEQLETNLRAADLHLDAERDRRAGRGQRPAAPTIPTASWASTSAAAPCLPAAERGNRGVPGGLVQRSVLVNCQPPRIACRTSSGLRPVLSAMRSIRLDAVSAWM